MNTIDANFSTCCPDIFCLHTLSSLVVPFILACFFTMLDMGTVSLGGLDHAVADVSNQTIHWPVRHVSRDCAHLSSNVLPLAQRLDFVRIFLRRAILLKWTAERVVELGFVTSLESVDTTGTFGIVFVRLARTGYESGVSLEVPMERIWMPFARAPQTDPSLLSCTWSFVTYDD